MACVATSSSNSASDRPERVAVGARWFAGTRWLTVVAARRHQDRWLVSLAELNDRTAAQQYTNTTIYAEPVDDPEALWVHELIGSDVVEVSGRSRGKCVAVVANPAADLLELDSGALVPVVFVTERRDGHDRDRPSARSLRRRREKGP